MTLTILYDKLSLNKLSVCICYLFIGCYLMCQFKVILKKLIWKRELKTAITMKLANSLDFSTYLTNRYLLLANLLWPNRYALWIVCPIPSIDYPGTRYLKHFFCYSNTRVIGSSSWVIHLRTQLFKLKFILRDFFSLLFLILIKSFKHD